MNLAPSRMLTRASLQRARRPAARRALRIFAGAAAHPGPGKPRSEDAWFADGATGVVGIADGVGGSKRKGVDPGAFSRRLMALCAASAGGGADAASAIAAARRLVRTDAVAKAGGSATALVVRVSRGSDAVELANFGDCAAALLRPTPRRFKMPKNAMVLWPRVVVRTAEQTHFFNCPYQVAAEDADEDDSELGGATVDSLSAQAKPGDIIVVASDGVWDNLDDDHIQRLVAEKVATLWASAGRHGAMFPEKELATISDDALAFETPSAVLAFLAETIAAEAIKEGIKGLQGGKADDVTVVVLLIVSDEAKFTADDESMMHNFAEFASVDHAAVAADAAYDAEILK